MRRILVGTLVAAAVRAKSADPKQDLEALKEKVPQYVDQLSVQWFPQMGVMVQMCVFAMMALGLMAVGWKAPVVWRSSFRPEPWRFPWSWRRSISKSGPMRDFWPRWGAWPREWAPGRARV